MAYDITFVGHMCFDEIVPFEGETTIAPGSAVLCGAMAAARAGARVAVVTRMAEQDRPILAPLEAVGVDCHLVPAPETTYMEVVHPEPDVDVRQMFQRRDAGFIQPDDVPDRPTRHLHLAGVTDREFPLDLLRALRQRPVKLSTDMQSFVRQVDPVTREIHFRDVPAKQQITALMDLVKLDIVEATLLTGEDDLERAAIHVEAWGCPRVVITRNDGVLARVAGKTLFAPFTNRNIVGRTGRGDTTLAAFLAWGIAHDAEEALRFAAALVSIKMESPGPFSGTVADVLARM